MCLSNAKIISPNEDLVCYKVCLVADRKVFSPYQYFPLKIGKRLKAFYDIDGVFSDEEISINGHKFEGRKYQNIEEDLYLAEGGVFHSFVKKEDAFSHIQQNFGKWAWRIYECIIPKDSKLVLKGYFDSVNLYDSYGSSEIILKEPVFENF